MYVSTGFCPSEGKSVFVAVKVLAQFHIHTQHWKLLPSQRCTKLLQHSANDRHRASISLCLQEIPIVQAPVSPCLNLGLELWIPVLLQYF